MATAWEAQHHAVMRATPAIAIVLFVGSASAADWHYSAGVHDYTVPQADSDTFGVDARVSMDEHTDSGWHYFGYADLFVDWDQDHLDPDHIPIWWQVHVGTDGSFLESGNARLGWTANFDTSMNTVSSIERRMTALPALIGSYDGSRFEAALKVGAGGFFLEIDDDVPKTRGYDRSDFRNSTFAWSTQADATVHLGDTWSVSGMALGWWDSDQTLLTEYKATLSHDTNQWRKGSALVISADYNEYNLDMYQRSGLPPILPWDHDLLFRVMLDKVW
jgi:hypothetical protein